MKYIHYIFLFLALIAFSQCESEAVGDISTSTGKGGSLARFTIVGNFLYTLEPNQLSWYKLAANGQATIKEGFIPLEDGKETIFPLGELLFIGATDGLSIFEITAGGEPVLKGAVQHFSSCDPVVANEHYAFVTLRQEGCNGIFVNIEDRNVLNIYNVDEISNPQIIASYDMMQPRGMGLAGDYLFLCEGDKGLRTLNISDPHNVAFLSFKTDIHANDVIVLQDLLLVIGPDNITQFDYSDPTNLIKISEIVIE